jgi:hypothetical protein
VDVVAVAAGAQPTVAAIVTVTGIGQPGLTTSAVVVAPGLETVTRIDPPVFAIGGTGEFIRIRLFIPVAERPMTITVRDRTQAVAVSDAPQVLTAAEAVEVPVPV